MKARNILLSTGLATALLTSCTQYHNSAPERERTIEVSGVAEKEVAPDEVYFTLTLQEYKKGGKKFSLADMEKKLIERAASVGIKKEDLQLGNLTAYSYNYYYGYDYYRSRDEVMAIGNYRIKLNSTEQMEKLLENKEGLNVTYAYLSSFSCSKKERYNDELREQALKITRAKAAKLLAAVGADVGEVISISDGGISSGNNNYYRYGYYYGPAEERQANTVSGAETRDTEPGVSPRNMKFRAEMKVVYKIK